MQSWKAWFKTPMPMRLFYIAWIPCFLFAVIAGFSTGTERAWPLLPAAIDGVLLGLCLALNINGAADAAATIQKQRRPFGMNLSGSFQASTTHARLVGAAFTAMATYITVMALTQ